MMTVDVQTVTAKLADEICKYVRGRMYGVTDGKKVSLYTNLKLLEQCSAVDVSLIKEKYGLQ